MKEEFLKCFRHADIIFILPIYSAGEKASSKINNIYISKLLQKKYKKKRIQPITDSINLYRTLCKLILKNDNIIFLGAGHSSKIANNFSDFFKDHVQ